MEMGPAEAVLREFLPEASQKSQDMRSFLIPILQKLQEAYGYLPQPVLTWVSRETGIPTSRMYGVITFYSQFYTEPHGRHTIR